MMAAAQPFISGAISKTINLPNNATVQDIKDCYRLSWELGLKANALYRDGCKLSQPLSTKSDQEEDTSTGKSSPAPTLAEAKPAATKAATTEPVRPHRRRLPDTRRSLTHKFNVAGHEGYVTVGIYDDGLPGELFITMAKEGSTIGGLMDSLGTATSVALQYGVPLESLVKKFTHQRFEPAGMTTNADIPFAKSLVDYIFRWLGQQFIPGYREASAPKRSRPDGGDRTTPADRAIETGDAGARAKSGESRILHAVHAESTTHAVVGPGLEGKGTRIASVHTETLSIALDAAGDAPPCDVCGTITVRSGTCYKCLNCGNSMGCS
jgi:ribonucleoside-diphosphate reductase alpha chain